MALRTTVFSLREGLKSLSRLQSKPSSKKLTSALILSVQMRFISSIEVTKNISLLSEEKKKCKVVNLKLEEDPDKPLLIMLSWLLARKKHVYKYADIYLKHGFDVLNISISPWQLLWPTKGSQVVAKDVLKFLDINAGYSPLVVHGFSVGAYLWSEVLVQMNSERQRYANVLDRIVGQIWDSSVDVTEIPIGVPVAIFPNNTVLQNTLKQYMLYHLKTFDKVATVHYVRASQIFHTNIVRAPAQIFLSKIDPIGTEVSNARARENWEQMGIQVNWKCFEKSPHVGHYRAHPKEYKAELENFLMTLNIPQLSKEPVKAAAKL